jgi:MoxR-like ATPase
MKQKKQQNGESFLSEVQNQKLRVQELISYMSKGLFEKEHILMMALLCAVAGESIFILGPPGTAKSLVSRRLKMGFKDAKSFEYLMSRFSTPDELFGPVSISKLKNEDKYERLVDGYLPDADIVFLDEIWKAGPAIQNTLLTAINEHIYQNGSVSLKLPMKVLIASSNELPNEDEGLEALWDRFIVRIVSNCISNEKTFYKMIQDNSNQEIIVPERLLLTEQLIREWRNDIMTINIPAEVFSWTTNIREQLQLEQQKEGVNKMDFYISDRRWKKVFNLMRASAFLNNRHSLQITDMVLLIYCLWNKVESIPRIIDIVLSSFTMSITQEKERIESELQKINEGKKHPENTTSASDGQSTGENIYVVIDYFFYILENFPQTNCRFAKADYNHISSDKDSDGILFQNSKGWVIHAIYDGTPFNYNKIGMSNIQKIRLRKCQGGVLMNGIPYMFKRRDDIKVELLSSIDTERNAALSIIEHDYCALEQKYQRLKDSLKEDNLFVSDDDKKLINKYLKSVEKALEILHLKINNSKML